MKMNQIMTKSLLPLLILALFLAAPTFSGAISFFPRLHVSIENALPDNTNPLTVHCQSKQDDLGYRTLAVNEMIE